MSNDKILIIGGSGFIGSHMTTKAIEKYQNVTVINLNEKDNQKKENVNTIICDICDEERLSKELSDKNFEYIINCSGYIDHSSLKQGGYKVVEHHFNGVLNIIKQINKVNLKAFIQLGSSDEYGDNESPQHEEQRESPISPYSLAKLSTTNLLQMLYKQDGFPAVIYRLFLVYGPGQSQNRFVPYTINSCLNNITFPVSEGHQVRDFCYIDDVTDAIIGSLDNKKIHGEVINLASGNPVTIREMINKICKLSGGGNPVFGKVPYREGENMSLYANIDKAKKTLAWSPKVSIDDGLEKTINFYKSTIY